MRSRSLFARLVASHLFVAVAALGVLGIAVDRVLERRAIADLETRLVAEARTLPVAVGSLAASARQAGDANDPLESLVRALGAASGARLTLIRSDGLVLADSEHDPRTMENHATRPEVRAALSGRTGAAQRTSDTLNRPFLYVAIPPVNGIVYRAALPATAVEAERSGIRRSVAASFLGIALLALVLSTLVARTVGHPLKMLTDEVARVARGDFAAIEPAGPAEARTLARAVNDMAAELASRVEQLRHETSLRDQILSSMSEGVMLAQDGVVAYANPAARALFGREELQALPPQVPVPSAGAQASAEFTLHHPATREVRCTASEVGDGRILVVAQDVTEAKRIDEIRRDFVANASHEMKTPVAGILATAETLQNAVHDDPETAERFAATLTKEATRLSALIQDLLSLARLEQAGGGEGVAPLSRIVADEIEEARPRADAKRIAIEATIAPGLNVRGRAEEIAQLPRNLLDNAIRYTGDGGSLAVTVRADGRTAILEVRDSGVGIPDKDLARIFERFYRVDRAHARDTGGTGLGLAIARHVAESLGGSVRATSSLGAGSTFTVELPLAPE